MYYYGYDLQNLLGVGTASVAADTWEIGVKASAPDLTNTLLVWVWVSKRFLWTQRKALSHIHSFIQRPFLCMPAMQQVLRETHTWRQAAWRQAWPGVTHCLLFTQVSEAAMAAVPELSSEMMAYCRSVGRPRPAM